MKLAVEMCDPGPGRLGPILAVPRIWSTSAATAVSPGGDGTQISRACAWVIPDSKANVSCSAVTSRTIALTCGQSDSANSRMSTAAPYRVEQARIEDLLTFR